MENIRTDFERYARLRVLEDEIYGKKGEKRPAEDNSAVKKAAIYNKAFWEHMHTGVPENALKGGSDGSGGYLVPDTYENRLVEGLAEKNIFRRIARTVPVTHRLRIPQVLSTGAAEWVPENTFVPIEDVTFGEIEITPHKIGTLALVTDELLEDSGFDLEAFINTMISERIGDCEEIAFIDGNGVGKPLGLLSQAQVGVVSERVGTLVLDDLVDMQHSIKTPYRDNAVWLMSEEARVRLQQLWLLHGRAVWEKSAVDGEPDMLLGKKMYISKNMPDVAPGSKPILYGNFDYFWIGDPGKRSIKRLSERYADMGVVGFLATQRVDTKLVQPEAVKVLQIKAE